MGRKSCPAGTVGVTNARARADASPRLDDRPAAGRQAECLRVGRVDLDVRVARVELAKDVRLGRSRLGVPLGALPRPVRS